MLGVVFLIAALATTVYFSIVFANEYYTIPRTLESVLDKANITIIKDIKNTTDIIQSKLTNATIVPVIPGIVTQLPSGIPSQLPSGIPSQLPSTIPSQLPSTIPSLLPTRVVSDLPPGFENNLPSDNIEHDLPPGLPYEVSYKYTTKIVKVDGPTHEIPTDLLENIEDNKVENLPPHLVYVNLPSDKPDSDAEYHYGEQDKDKIPPNIPEGLKKAIKQNYKAHNIKIGMLFFGFVALCSYFATKAIREAYSNAHKKDDHPGLFEKLSYHPEAFFKYKQ